MEVNNWRIQQSHILHKKQTWDPEATKVEHPPQDLLVDAGSTKDLVVTAQCSQLSNGVVEHGPLWLNVSSLTCNAIKALLEGRIQDLVDWELCQIFIAHPHYTRWEEAVPS